MPLKRFQRMALGGTFDILHKGHEKTLLKAFSLSEKVLIGLSTKRLATSIEKNHEVEPYMKRREGLKKFLREKGLLAQAEIIPLDSRYGVAHELEDLDAIMVSRETRPVALQITEIRRQKGMKPLEIVLLEKLPAEDGKPISSTRIRRGEIDADGRICKRKIRMD